MSPSVLDDLRKRADSQDVMADLRKRAAAQSPTTAPAFPTAHPTVQNEDGTTSNVMMSSFEFEGKHLVLPTMVGGKQLSNDDAVAIARQQGLDKYPSFASPEEAEAWIQENHAKVAPPKGEPLVSDEPGLPYAPQPVDRRGKVIDTRFSGPVAQSLRERVIEPGPRYGVAGGLRVIDSAVAVVNNSVAAILNLPGNELGFGQLFDPITTSELDLKRAITAGQLTGQELKALVKEFVGTGLTKKEAEKLAAQYLVAVSDEAPAAQITQAIGNTAGEVLGYVAMLHAASGGPIAKVPAKPSAFAAVKRASLRASAVKLVGVVTAISTLEYARERDQGKTRQESLERAGNTAIIVLAFSAVAMGFRSIAGKAGQARLLKRISKAYGLTKKGTPGAQAKALTRAFLGRDIGDFRALRRGVKQIKASGLDINSTGAVLKSAFRAMSKRVHPDITGRSGEMFDRLNKAYEAIASGRAFRVGAPPAGISPISLPAPTKPGELVPTKPTQRTQAVEALNAQQAALQATALRPTAPAAVAPSVVVPSPPPAEAPIAPAAPEVSAPPTKAPPSVEVNLDTLEGPQRPGESTDKYTTRLLQERRVNARQIIEAGQVVKTHTETGLGYDIEAYQGVRDAGLDAGILQSPLKENPLLDADEGEWVQFGEWAVQAGRDVAGRGVVLRATKGPIPQQAPSVEPTAPPTEAPPVEAPPTEVAPPTEAPVVKPTLFHGSPKAGLTEIRASRGDFGQGVYLADETTVLRDYSPGRKNVAAFVLGDTAQRPKEGNVYAVQHGMKNPLHLNKDNWGEIIDTISALPKDNKARQLLEGTLPASHSEEAAIAVYAKQQGHDGIIEQKDRGQETIVFAESLPVIPTTPPTEAPPAEVAPAPTEAVPPVSAATRRVVKEVMAGRAAKIEAKKKAKARAAVRARARAIEEAKEKGRAVLAEEGLGKSTPGFVPKSKRSVKALTREVVRGPKETKLVTARNLLRWVQQAKQRAAAQGYRAGSTDIAAAHKDLVQFAKGLLPLSQQQKVFDQIAAARTNGQIVTVARQIALQARKNRIRQVVGEEIIVTPLKLLKWSMRQAQKTSARAYIAGARGVVDTHSELMDYAKENLPVEYQARAMPVIGKARTPAEITAAVASIDILSEKVKMGKAVQRFETAKKALDLKHMPQPQRGQAETLLDTITADTPSDSALRSALKLHDRVKASDIEGQEGPESPLNLEVPDYVITRMEGILARAERVPLRKLTPEAIDSISEALEHIRFLANNKNRLLANRRYSDARKAVQSAAKEVQKFTHDPRRLQFRRRPGLVYRYLFNLQSHETVIDYLMGLEGVGGDVLVNTLREGINESAEVHLEAAEVIREAMEGLDFKKWSDTKPKLRQKIQGKLVGRPVETIATLIDTTLPAARWKDGKLVGSIKLTHADRISFWLHLNDSQTRRAILRNRSEGIVLSRALDKPIKLTKADVSAILESVTTREKQIAKALQKYVNGPLRARLNEKWESQRGYALAGRTDHWSRYRSNETTDLEPDKFIQQWADRYLDQQRPFHPRTGGTKPIVIGDAFNEFYRHTMAASTYLGRHGPSVDAMRMLRSADFRTAVRNRVKYGDYWLQKMEDVVRSYRGLDQVSPGAMGRLVSRTVRGAHVALIGLKPWIWFYQPVSYSLVLSEVDAKYVTMASEWTFAGNKQAEQEIRKYAPDIHLRFEGGGHAIFTPSGEGMGLEQFVTGKLPGGVPEKVGMAGVRKFDKGAIVNIWQILKAEAKDKGESLEYAARRLHMLVGRTQPSSDLLSVSGLTRESFRHPLMKPLVMFTNQRSKITNMMIRTAVGYRRGTKTKAEFVKMAALLTLNTAIIYTIRAGAVKLLSDDDDEKTWSRHASEFAAMVLSNIQVAGAVIGRATRDLHKYLSGESYRIGQGDDVVESVVEDAVATFRHGLRAAGAGSEMQKTGPQRGKKWKLELQKAAKRAVLPLSVILKAPGPAVQKMGAKVWGLVSPTETDPKKAKAAKKANARIRKALESLK